ncbi:hypothetical protein NLJ89_g594 [Agrocybe chaxingu]|uniref:Hydrophobin n=1 Tax=Agrocybe chaxingu TaxID=84603 RepID=A0A9W8N1J3_9AGAR|nr:hypothetical protein NLJ89_g594 [Agrocybe chaxingu]
MFSKFSLLFTATLASSAVAGPTGIYSSCNTGPVQCCNKLAVPDSAAASKILSLAAVDVQPVTALVGAQCTHVTAIGLGSGAAWRVPIILILQETRLTSILALHRPSAAKRISRINSLVLTAPK